MNRSLAIVAALLVLTGGQAGFGRVQITKTTNRKPAESDSDGRMANLVFREFLGCDQGTDPKAKFDFEKTVKCARKVFWSGVSNEQVNRYAEAIVFPNKYSELFYCDEKMTKIVQVYEDKGYDLFLCFESNILAPDTRIGVAFFKKEKGIPRLMKLKM